MTDRAPQETWPVVALGCLVLLAAHLILSDRLPGQPLLLLAAVAVPPGTDGRSHPGVRALLHDQADRQRHRSGTGLRSYIAMGRPEAAIEQYRLCEQLLKREYDLEPRTARSGAQGRCARLLPKNR